MCHLCDDLDYLYPEDLHPTDCIDVAWEVFDLWERNEQEMSTELCYKNNEYLENEWQREYDLKYDHGYYDELYWEEEYEMYSEQEEEYENWLWSLTDDALEIGKEQKLIRYKDKIWNKRKKHIKDTKRHFREVNRHQCWIEYSEVSYHEHVTHKHKRAERIYTEEEYLDTYDEYTWYETEWLGLNYEWWLEDPWLYDEVGYGWLINEDWRDYVICKGGVSFQVRDVATKLPKELQY